VAANLVTLVASVVLLVGSLIVIGVPLRLRLLALLPACAVAVLFVTSLGLVLGGMYVYFRDVKFVVGAALTVWLYVTPVVYTPASLGHLGRFLPYNPLTGVVETFQWAAVGAPFLSWSAAVTTLVTCAVLLFLAVYLHRTHDRRFVDLL
jgi:ABC-type polysaccharide/polyol phosphate export permease